MSSHFSGNASEWDAYLGIPLVLLLVLATVRFWVLVIRTGGIVAAIFAVCSLGPQLHVAGHQLSAIVLPWWIPAHLPLLENILPARLMM